MSEEGMMIRSKLYRELGNDILNNKISDSIRLMISENRLKELGRLLLDSASLIEKIEKEVLTTKGERKTTNEDEFLKEYCFNIVNDDNSDSFIKNREEIINRFREKSRTLFVEPTLYGFYAKLIQSIVTIQNKLLRVNKNGYFFGINDGELNESLNNNKVLTFLSYAHSDKGLTICLFNHFYKRGGYLYIDWMHNPSLTYGKEIKDALCPILDKSAQLLLLRSPNSEIKHKGDIWLRPWCSFEVGYYRGDKKNDDTCFYVSNYNTSKVNNTLVDTFKPIKEVKNGIIYSW